MAIMTVPHESCWTVPDHSTANRLGHRVAPTSFAGSNEFQYCPYYHIQSIKLPQRHELSKSHCRAMAARQEPLKRCSSETLHQLRNLRLCISDYSGYVKHQLKSLSLNVGRDRHVSYHHLTAVWFNVH